MVVPLLDIVRGEVPRAIGVDGLAVSTHDSINILGTTRTALDLEDTHTSIEHLIEEVDRLQVLGRHDVLVVDLQLDTRLLILDLVGAAADLRARATVSALTLLVQAEVALTRDGHTEGAVGEHLDTDGLTSRADDGLLYDRLMDGSDLVHIQLTCQDHDVGKLCVEAQRLDVGDIELGGEVDFDTDTTRVEHGCDVGSDDSRHVGSLRRVDDLTHERKVFVVDDRIDGKIALDVMLTADRRDLIEVFGGEVIRTLRAHVEAFDTEVYGVSTRVDSRHERLIGAHGGHDFVIFPVHL